MAVTSTSLANQDKKKTAQDWVRQLRFSNNVNRQTLGVDTDHVTPELMLAASNKLLGISRGQQQGDQKDALQFQRIYGPVQYFAQRIQKDGGSVARSMLWKATNRGNVDFIGSGSLQPHINAVFNQTNLSQFVDNSTPLEGVDASQKVTRIGEGGISSQDSAPIQMRLVQPSYAGYVDPVRTAEKCYLPDTQVMTKAGWKNITELTMVDQLAVLIDGKPSWSAPLMLQRYDHDGLIYCYDDDCISFAVTPGHRMYVSEGQSFEIQDIDFVFGNSVSVLRGQDVNNVAHRYTLNKDSYSTIQYTGKVYCPTVPGGLIYVRRGNAKAGFWCGNSPGITGYLTKNVLKGTDGKLYQKLYNVKTGQEELVDSQTAATKTVTTNEYMGTPDKYVYAIGGSKGVKIVPRSSVDYILPRSDDLFSGNSNLVPMLSGIKAMRLLMGCHHPQTPIVVLDKNGYTDIIPAKRTGHIGDAFLFGCDSKGKDAIYPLRNVVTRVPQKNSKFKTIVLESGRYLPTSKQHKWYIYDGQSFKLVYAKDLKPGMLVPRSMFTSLPVRTTEVMGVPVTKQICVLMGRLIRSLTSAQYNYKFTFLQDAQKGIFQKADIEKALKQLQVKQCNIFRTKGVYAVTIKDPVFIDWIEQNIGCSKETIRVPKEILSLPSGFTCAFLDSFYKDMTGIGEDGNEDTWILDLPNDFMRDAMSLMLSKIYTDTQYKDAYKRLMNRKALKLVPMKTGFGDVILEKIVKVYDSPAPAVMIDIDCDDNVYAAGNGIITHNSKYGNQAVPLQQREAPLVRSLDQATGMDTPTILGKLLGTQWSPKSGMVKAVREDRIDMLYDDGTEGSVPLYKDFPANAKGWLTNYPKVKAGDKVDKGALLATSNYTDDNGVLAMGRNLRVAYMSFHGGTYEDACVLSESAAKKMGYTIMYKTDMQKDKSIRTAKTLYKTWKPGQFSKQQFDNLDDQGVVKPGAVLHHGDPVILGIRTTEPSPGTLGKRILTDVTETWEHANPGVVTDVINTKNGIKVFAKVSSPLKVGDKISGFEGNKGTVAQIIPDDEMPQDSKGNPIQLLFDPLGIVSRCYDKETKFLTRQGWKFGKDISLQDQLYVFDPATDSCRWGKQLQPMYKKHYKGLMFGAKNVQCDFLVTYNHTMWARSDYYKSSFKQTKIQDIYNKRYYIPAIRTNIEARDKNTYNFQLPTLKAVSGRHKEHLAKPIIYKGQLWAKLLGWYLTQGNTTYNEKTHQYKVHISQSKSVNPAQWQQINALLSDLQLTYHYSDKNIQFHIQGKRIAYYFNTFGKCYEKFIPQWLERAPLQLKQVFLECVLKGDGRQFYTKKGVHCASIALTSYRLIEQLHIICTELGYRAVIRPVKVKPKHHPMWRLAISYCNTNYMLRGDTWYTCQYDDMVYCPTVQTGYVVSCRNSKVLCAGNTNPSQLMQAGLGKVAAKLGHPIIMPQFQKKGESRLQYVKKLMKDNNVPYKENVYDPNTGRTVSNVFVGRAYFMPLKHIADTKMSARGTSTYTAQEIPASGGQQGSKRLGGLESAALVGHNAFDFLKEAKLIRGQSNADFWRSIRIGQIPVMPGEPLVHKKFFATLQASGVNIQRNKQGVSIFALTNKDVDEMAKGRQLKSTDTYQQKNFRPIAGGLFGADIFGDQGTNWGYIQLDKPLPNPVMQEPLARLLRMSDQDFQAVIRGQKEVNGIHNSSQMKAALSKLDLQKEANTALRQLKQASPSRRDAALKRYVAIGKMRDNGVHPQQYMLDRIPVLPPIFRPISSHGGLTMVADSNYLYAQLLNARDDAREAKNLPAQYQQKAQANIYDKWKQLVGLYDPRDVKLRNKNVKGLLKWALGKSSKWSAFQRKVLGSTVDTVGRGVVVPSTKIKLNEIGMPVQMAWNVYAPFVTRKLVQQGYSPVDAMKLVKEHSNIAKPALVEAVNERPVVMNRAPSLHKLSLMGFNVRLTDGHAIKTNPSIVSPFGMDYDGNCVDFDSKISLKLSKSALEIFTDFIRLETSQKTTEGSKEMRVSESSKVEVSSKDSGYTTYATLKIGKMPRLGTPVKDKNGADVYKMPEGVSIVACDPVTGEKGFYEVEALTVEDNCHTVKVEAGNHSVIISDNESMAVFDKHTGKLAKVRPADLEGYYVPVLKKSPLPFGLFGNRDIGWILGSLISDGWICNNIIGYAKLEEGKRAEVERIFRSINPNFVIHTYEEKGQNNGYKLGDSKKIHIYSPDLVSWLKQFELLDKNGDYTKKTACSKQISHWLLTNASEECLWGILSGLIDGDGSLVVNTYKGKQRFGCRYATSSPSLRDSLTELLYRLGIRYSITTTPPRNWSNEAYTICPSTIDLYRNIDKLSCIGNRETEMINQWKKAAPVYEDKKDQVPVSDAEWEILKSVVPVKSGLYCACISGKKNKSRTAMRSNLTPYLEFLKENVPTLYSRVNATDTLWYQAEVTEDMGNRQVFDLMVKDAKVFAVNNGFIIWDTANLHVPVSKAAITDVRQKMMPERNLISMRKNKILYMPQKAYTQGLYVATRMDQKDQVHTFNNLKEAKQAYHKGQINVDTPIIIG